MKVLIKNLLWDVFNVIMSSIKNKIHCKLYFMFFIPMLLVPILSHSQEVKDLVSLYFNEVRANNYPAIPKQLSLGENAKATLAALEPYFTDTVQSIRAKAYAIAQLAGSNSRVPIVREGAVRQLVNACRDRDAGNVGLALSYLTNFQKEDFSIAARDSIKSLVKRNPPHFDQLLKLAGFLELQDLKGEIKPYTQPGNPKQVRWAAILSLARMNDATALQDMMTRIKKLQTNDDVVYEIFPDLVYSRQREALDYLVVVLNSDDKKCMSADAEREAPITCGYRVMEQLAPAIEGYPLQLEVSGDVKTKDYTAALNTVRDWFRKHPHYEINRNTY